MTPLYERLHALKIALPREAPPVVAGYVPVFVPFVQTGNLIYLSGRLAKKDGHPWSGQLGADVTTAEGKDAARGIAIEMLATLHVALGDLDRVRRIVRLFVMVNSTQQYTEPHVVANGASELLIDVFGERGAHARTAVCVAQAPFGACVESDLIVEVDGAILTVARSESPAPSERPRPE
jgi:enamine deaminase RidA (YjgF/YER057c/UK114 family)